MRNISRAIKLLPGWQKLVFGVAIVTVFQAAVLVSVPLVIQRVINNLFQSLNGSGVELGVVALPLLLWAILRVSLTIVNWITEIISDNAYRLVAGAFRERSVDKLEKLSITYYEKRRAGQIASEVNQAPFQFASWLQNLIEDYLPLLIQALFSLAVLTYKFALSGLIVALLGILYAWYTLNTMKQNRIFWKNNRAVINEWSGIQTENISFVTDIRALGITKNRGEKYRKYLRQHDQNLFTMFKYQHLRNFVASLIEVAMYGVPILLFAFRALNGQQSPTDIYVLAVYLGTISNAVGRIGRIWSDTSNLNDTVGETLDILDQEDNVQDPAEPIQIESIEKIELSNVSFSYDGDTTMAINDFSLKFTPGTTTAFVGRSGAGKSTVIKLLLRFYDPNSGDILLNGNPLSSYSQDDFRSKIGVVMQDVALFNDTIFNNIAIAVPEATKSEVIAASKLAHAHTFISKLPNGYETLVGERGVRLSGGEKQRISIARAALRKPELVLLDEATSALDSESEELVQKGLADLLKNRTAVVIAHRLSTIRHADVVVVIDNGIIVEKGSYDTLKKAGGLFADLLERQEL